MKGVWQFFFFLIKIYAINTISSVSNLAWHPLTRSHSPVVYLSDKSDYQAHRPGGVGMHVTMTTMGVGKRDEWGQRNAQGLVNRANGVTGSPLRCGLIL